MKTTYTIFILIVLVIIGCKKKEDDTENAVTTISGCTDSKAKNFNAKATNDDGSCKYATPKIVFYSKGSWVASHHSYGEITLFNTDAKITLGTIKVAKNMRDLTCTSEIQDSTILRLLEPGVHNYKATFKGYYWDYYEPGNEASAYLESTDMGEKIFQLDIPSDRFYCETYDVTK